jgi:hypothetical protein
MNRTCGECTLCCKLVPVAEIGKPAGKRCQHQAHHVGCRVYDTNRMPSSCRLWNCAWLADEQTVNLRRPDRSHYVIDTMPDFVTLQPNDGGPATDIPVLQIWIDPAYPDAHRDPALRAMLDKNHAAALVRFSSKDAFLLAPPSVANDGKWHEQTSGTTARKEHSLSEVLDVMEQRGMLDNGAER